MNFQIRQALARQVHYRLVTANPTRPTMQHLIKPIRSWRAAVLPATFFCGLLATFPAPAQGLAWLQADTSLLHYTSSGVPMADLSEGATPLSLITIDFDHDGIPDLVAGFDSAGAGRLKLLRGQGIGAVPAFVPAGWVEIPFPPDLLATLDFDRDGRADLVVASRHHRRLLWLAGAVDGGLEPAIVLALAVWGRDGGTQLVSMDTALAEPAREALPLADAVAAVALRLDADAFTDLAVLTAEGELTTVIQGTTPTFTVNSTGDQNDANPGDGICSITEPPPASPTCTLRAAIDEANELFLSS
jgi:CSLREA domain-containing protein